MNLIFYYLARFDVIFLCQKKENKIDMFDGNEKLNVRYSRPHESKSMLLFSDKKAQIYLT